MVGLESLTIRNRIQDIKAWYWHNILTKISLKSINHPGAMNCTITRLLTDSTPTSYPILYSLGLFSDPLSLYQNTVCIQGQDDESPSFLSVRSRILTKHPHACLSQSSLRYLSIDSLTQGVAKWSHSWSQRQTICQLSPSLSLIPGCSIIFEKFHVSKTNLQPWNMW